MNRETRNTKVVVCLILAMTAGMQILLWLEPKPPRVAPPAPLTAVDGVPIEDVRIEYADSSRLADVDASAADCVILPDGACNWRPGGPGVHARVVVAGSGTATELADVQKESLLTVLQGIAQARGGQAVPVSLEAGSDATGRPASAEAKDLRRLLVRKRMID